MGPRDRARSWPPRFPSPSGRRWWAIRTYGRAAVQKAVPLEDGGLVITVARYVSPKGKELHGKGLEPSVPVERADLDDDEDETPAAGAPDPFIEKALEVLKAEVKKAA